MKQTTKHLGIFLIAVMLLTAVIPLLATKALAGESVDLEKPCSVNVKLNTEAFMDDEANVSAAVGLDIYEVAKAVPMGGFDTYEWEFSDNALKEIVGDTSEDPDWKAIAQALADKILAEGSGYTPVVKATEAPLNTDVTLPEAGLYLIVPRGKDLTEWSEYTKMSEAGLAGSALTPEFEYLFTPQLISLPTKEADEDGVIMTSGDYGDWLYSMDMNLKPDRKERKGSLDIVKTLLTYELREGRVPREDEATFDFKVVATKNGKIVYSNVVALKFDAAGTQVYHIVDKIPLFAEVTVTEIYSGAQYVAVGATEKTTTITADEVASVEFENDYSEEDHGGGSVINHFENSGEGEDWTWQQGDPTQETVK